jgi:uncharacterized protein YecE (DUF72 family)
MTITDRQIPFYIGTMGFSYKDWSGIFYPPGMNSMDYLGYYSRIFKSVEIDSSFYGSPKKSTIQRWKSETPADFKFSLKVPRMITHEMGLVNAWGQMAEFIETIRLLAERLGVILFQFPPSFKVDQMNRLSEFLARLPDDLCFSIEIRDGSWYTAENQLVELLAKRKIGWAATQYPNLPGKIYTCSSFIYIRWIGQHGSFHQHDHERIDRIIDLQGWWQHIQENMGKMTELFGYFNNDYAGYAAGTALKFKALIGEEVHPPQHTRLF